MVILLTLLIVSFLINFALFVPFINLLYRLRFQRQKQKTRDMFEKLTPIFDLFHGKKVGTPVGGGMLIIGVTAILFPLFLVVMHYFFVPITIVYSVTYEVGIILFTFLSFGLLGLYDDLKKTFFWEKELFFGLRLRHKLFVEIVLAFIIGSLLYYGLGIDILHIPFFGVWKLGVWFIPFAAFTIVAFTNAYNITDGLDGLAAGVLVIALIAFWVISASILDTPLSVFIALWVGSLLAFLYFNIYPARIFLGDVGALSFGATFAVIGLILGKILAIVIIGGIFILEVSTSLAQLLSKRFLKKKVMKVAPLHLWLQHKGWDEPKVVMRFWILNIMFAVVGLWFAFFNRPYA